MVVVYKIFLKDGNATAFTKKKKWMIARPGKATSLRQDEKGLH